MAGVKMFCALPRRKDIPVATFHDHWRHPHGTWGLKIDTVAAYVQSHRVATPLLGEDQGRYEGVVEVWFDARGDAAGMGDHPGYRDWLAPDEPNFIDMAGISFLFAKEDILVPGPWALPETYLMPADKDWCEERRPHSIKLIQLIDDPVSEWRSDADEELGWRIGALRHVCSEAIPDLNPVAPRFVGVRELWWPTVSAFEAGVRRDTAAWSALLERPSRSATLLVQAERYL